MPFLARLIDLYSLVVWSPSFCPGYRWIGEIRW